MNRMVPFLVSLFMLVNVNLNFSQSFTWQVSSTFMFGNPGDFISNHTYLLNNTSNTVDLRVIILNYTVPNGWYGYYCPPYACLPFSIDTSAVFTLNVSNYDSLLIDFQTNMVPAVGTVSVKIENVHNSSEYLVKNFSVSTDPTKVSNHPNILTGKLQLYSNYPNPFNPETKIPFEIGGHQSQQTIITVYNIVGQIVKTVLDQKMNPGVHQVIWDGTNNQGRPVASGLYLYELRTQNVVMMGKMFLLR